MPLQRSLVEPQPPAHTFFAPAERLSGDALAADVARVAESPVVDALLRSLGTAAFVVNAHRQVLAANTAALRMLGIQDPEGLLGLRPGEAVHCVHSHEEPGGCGTARACASCGAVLAILVALKCGHAEERRCALRAQANGEAVDVDLRVRAVPFSVEGQDLVLLALVDAGLETRHAAMERAFLHDLSNVLTGLVMAADAVGSPDPREADEAASDVRLIADRLVREVQLQRTLATTSFDDYRPALEPVRLADLFEDLSRLFVRHPVAAGRILTIDDPPPGEIRTDRFLVARILTNMLKNAFEATARGGEVRLGAKVVDGAIRFEVHNPGAIPAAVVPRIFQRHFTTKAGPGRGEGTWSMKSLGERLLRGEVGFASGRAAGTTFWLRLPREAAS
ncbi:MAG TPA: HAMP domain-containing sensor histidine kinase [Anaeromyxobacteraceae bacterium]|nr:HAMP domain-containing sensor histidine kinase [Anaeromyxobacteraceae bacterium]